MIAPVLAAAESADANDIDGFLLVVGLLGGLAIFLLGMEQMTESLRIVAGDKMRDLLRRLTENRFIGLATGAGITAVIQSSSVTTVLIVGFITSGLMSFEQSLGAILGANIGTTITAQIIAFKITSYALLAVAVGFAITFISKDGERKAKGSALLGLGLVFFGMTIMGDAVSPLRQSQTFIDAMVQLENPFFGIAVGAGFTAIVQSSSATTGIVIVLAQQGLISLDTGIALILGANVGTSVTAILAALGKPRAAMRAAAAHTLFNTAGALVWLPFIGLLSSMVSSIGGGTAREIANAHTIFNVANAFLAIGFTAQLAALVERFVKDRPADEEAQVQARYLDTELIRTPSLALDRARLELLRMSERVRRMLHAALPAVLTGTRWDLQELESMDDEVDSLHGQIVAYLGKISQVKLGDAGTQELIGLMEATNDLEAIGDILETNIVSIGMSRIEQGVSISPQTQAVLGELHEAVAEALDLAMLALTQKNADAARRAGNMKKHINSLERAAGAHQQGRLVADEPNRVEVYRLETDIIRTLKRVYYFTKRMARQAVPELERAALIEE
jgi:phosphate:Na+ symporter